MCRFVCSLFCFLFLVVVIIVFVCLFDYYYLLFYLWIWWKELKELLPHNRYKHRFDLLNIPPGSFPRAILKLSMAPGTSTKTLAHDVDISVKLVAKSTSRVASSVCKSFTWNWTISESELVFSFCLVQIPGHTEIMQLNFSAELDSLVSLQKLKTKQNKTKQNKPCIIFYFSII